MIIMMMIRMMIEMMQSRVLLALGAYLVGSIPTGYLIAKLAGIADIRNHGSGNIGATNVARLLGIHGFFLVLCIDALKAYGYLRFAQWISLSETMLVILSLLLLCGNVHSVFLGFRGGKGVATSVGIAAALMPELFFSILGIWIIVFAITKTVGIASVIGSIALPLIACYQYGLMHVYTLLSVTIAVSLLVTHRSNISRFLQTLSF